MKKGLQRTALVLVSALVGYFLVEGAMQLFIARLPKQVFAHQGPVLSTVAQTSMAGKVPREPYIAILGDSYAVGVGDWLAENEYRISSRSQAAHLIQEALGRDVLPLARSGAGNFDGPVLHAENVLQYLRKRGFEYPDPATLIVYFYAGNDPLDNVRLVERHFDPRHGRAQLFDDEAWEEFSEEMLALHASGRIERVSERFLAGNLVSRFVEGKVYSANHRDDPPAPEGKEYRARIGGEFVQTVAAVENACIPLGAEEIEVATRVFDRSLHALARRWPSCRKLAVFIPEPWTTYDFVDAGSEERMRQSLDLARRVGAAAALHDFEFLDAAVPLRAAAREEYMHGPRDWGHLNRAGYRVLADTLLAELTSPGN